MEASEYRAMFAVEDTHFWYRALHGHVLALLEKLARMPRRFSTRVAGRVGWRRD